MRLAGAGLTDTLSPRRTPLAISDRQLQAASPPRGQPLAIMPGSQCSDSPENDLAEQLQADFVEHQQRARKQPAASVLRAAAAAAAAAAPATAKAARAAAPKKTKAKAKGAPAPPAKRKSKIVDEATRGNYRVRLPDGTSKGFVYTAANKQAKLAEAQTFLETWLAEIVES